MTEDLPRQQFTMQQDESHVTVNRDSSLSHKSSLFVRIMRKIYRPLGFSKGYNFPLFVIFAGAMLGFSLARLSYINISGNASSSFKNSSSPGEWYKYQSGHWRVGITLHLGAIIPAGLLSVWQFVPVIRHKFILFHRLNGYLLFLLTTIGNVGALMIARRAFGGGLDTQSAVGTLVILTTVSLSMAYYNIKHLQIDQHRAWMLRAWFYFGTIITTRLILICSAVIISAQRNYYQVQTCGEVAYGITKSDRYVLPPFLAAQYPSCVTGTAETRVLVNANFSNGGPSNVGAALGLSFGMAIWISILLHALGVEIYLNLTPKESERLRQRSYERQLEAGFKNPGSAGLVIERFGDAPEWKPQAGI